MSSNQPSPPQTDSSKPYQNLKLTLSVTEFILGLAILSAFLGFGLSQKLEETLRLFTQNDYIVLIGFVTILGVFEGILLFPLSLYSGFILEHRYSLTDQRFGSWLWEQIKAILVSYPILLILITIFYTLLRHFPSSWWFWMGTVMVFFSIIIARLAPILLFPLFYKFTPLKNRVLAEQVADLCHQVGLKLEGVYQFNLSKTTRKANAAFTGIGKSKRVILGDTLIDNMETGEILAVLAHELGHYKMKHIWKGMAVGVILTFLGLYLVSLLYTQALPLFNFRYPYQIAALPLIGILLTLYQFITTPLQNIYSRQNERAADDFAIDMFGDSSSLISGLEKLAEQNLSDRSPHPLVEFLFYSHPSIDKRTKRLTAQP